VVLFCLEQSHVLDRDHRLIGEGADQFDVPVRERLNPLACKAYDTDRLALAQQWHPELGADLAESGRFRKGVLGIGGDIGDVHYPALQDDSSGNRPAIWTNRVSL
jgi:hypothetical protein